MLFIILIVIILIFKLALKCLISIIVINFMIIKIFQPSSILNIHSHIIMYLYGLGD